jgi:1,4-dihydroxy-2-naphthoate octaprenyltransferase
MRRASVPAPITDQLQRIQPVATLAQWIAGSRPRTLPMAVAPVVIGSAAAFGLGEFKPVNAVLAALVALLLQVGVNYANDYSDGIRGTDDNRVGPFRLTGSKAAEPAQVKRAAFIAFGAAMVFGLFLVVLSQTWWLLLVGLGCVAAAWGYTGGKNPYGYLGLGDVFVFVFFGLVATLGTTYTQALTLSPSAWIGAVGTGLIADALLMANNVRDIPTDRVSGKRTLAVRLGDYRSRRAYVGMLGVAVLSSLLLVPWNPWMLMVLLLVPACLTPAWLMLGGKKGPRLIPVLQQTGFINLGYAALFSLAIVLGTVF